MFQYSKLKLNDFTGGITDKYIDGPPNTYQKCVNMDITKFGSLETRVGFKWYLEANTNSYATSEAWAYLGVLRRPFAPDDIIINQGLDFYALNDEVELTFNTKTIASNVITFDTDHELATDDEVYIKDVTDSNIGISQDTKYYFIKTSATQGSLSLTAAGSAITLNVDISAKTNIYDQAVTLVKKATASLVTTPQSGKVLKSSTIDSNQPVCFTEWQDHLLTASKGASDNISRPARIYYGSRGFVTIANEYSDTNATEALDDASTNRYTEGFTGVDESKLDGAGLGEVELRLKCAAKDVTSGSFSWGGIERSGDTTDSIYIGKNHGLSEGDLLTFKKGSIDNQIEEYKDGMSDTISEINEVQVTFDSATIDDNEITFDEDHGLYDNDEVTLNTTNSSVGIEKDITYYFEKTADNTGKLHKSSPIDDTELISATFNTSNIDSSYIWAYPAHYCSRITFDSDHGFSHYATVYANVTDPTVGISEDVAYTFVYLTTSTGFLFTDSLFSSTALTASGNQTVTMSTNSTLVELTANAVFETVQVNSSSFHIKMSTGLDIDGNYAGPDIKTFKMFPAPRWNAETLGLPKPGITTTGVVEVPLDVYEPFFNVTATATNDHIENTLNLWFGAITAAGYFWHQGSQDVFSAELNLKEALTESTYVYRYKTVYKYIYKVGDVEYTTYGPTSEPVSMGVKYRFGEGYHNVGRGESFCVVDGKIDRSFADKATCEAQDSITQNPYGGETSSPGSSTGTWVNRAADNVTELMAFQTAIDVKGYNISTEGPYTDANWDLNRVMIELYRTTANGSLYYYIGETHNTDTEEYGLDKIYDTVTDEDLVYRKELYTNDDTVDFWPAPKCKYVISTRDVAYYCNVIEDYFETNDDPDTVTPSLANGSIFPVSKGTIREKVRPNRVYQSVPGIVGSIGETFYIDLDDEITGAGEIAGLPVIFTGSYIYRLEGMLDNTGDGTFRSRVVDEHVGCLAHASIVKTPMGLYFAGNNGFYVTDGYKIKPLTADLEQSYSDLISSDTAKTVVNGTYDERNQKIYWGVAKRGSTVADLVWVLDLASHGFTMMDAPRFEATSMVTRNGELYRGDQTGVVYRHSNDFKHDYPRTLSEATASTLAAIVDVHNWDKRHIDFEYISSATHFGDPARRKWVNEATFSLEAPGNIGVVPTSLNDANNITTDLKEITRESTWTWRDPDFSWKSENFKWAMPDVVTAPRRFPRKESRCRRKQIGLKPFRHKMYTSGTAEDPAWGLATVTFDISTGTLGLFTANLSEEDTVHTETTYKEGDYRAGDSFIWPKNLDGAYIHFPTTFSLTSKRYVYDDESTTYTAFRIIDRLDNNNITFRGALAGIKEDMIWYISAFSLSQKVEIKEISIKYGALDNVENRFQSESEVGE